MANCDAREDEVEWKFPDDEDCVVEQVDDKSCHKGFQVGDFMLQSNVLFRYVEQPHTSLFAIVQFFIGV